MSATSIRPCTCRHAFQDERYGAGQRLHNQAKRKDGGVKWRCTVCAREKES